MNFANHSSFNKMKMTFTYRCGGSLGVVELAGKKDFYAAVKAWEKFG